jgi:hypothetical protein
VEEVFVYPNPADNFIKVSTVFDKNELVTVSLTDIQGKAVKSIRDQRVSTGKVEFLVDVSGIGAGYYVLTVSAASGETRYSQKVRID